MIGALVLIISLLNSQSQAAGPGVTYQGRILKPDGNPLEGASVQFRMQVRSPGSENCLLFEEVQTINMTSSSGAFSLTLNDGSGTRLDAGPASISRIFANRDTLTLDATRCTSGTTYTPSATDGRKFIVYFKDETMTAYEPLPVMSLNYIPQSLYALESQKVGTFASENLLRAVDVSGNPTTAPALTPTQLSTLGTLLSGSGGTSSSAITGAVGTNSIDNTNYAQTWNWSTATTQNPMTMTSDALTTGSLFNLTTSSPILNSTSGLLNVANTGASTNGILARFQANSTAGSGLTVLTNGFVGIGTTTPTQKLDVNGQIHASGDICTDAGGGKCLSTAPSSLQGLTSGATTYNTFLGSGAGASVTTGSRNVYIGANAGYNNLIGEDNVFIGHYAGENETGSNKLYIANTNTTDPLIYGDFASGKVGIGTSAPSETLHVYGGLKAGSIKIGGNSQIDKMGICEIDTVAITNSPGTYSCADIPGSDIAVHCSGSAAMTTPGSNGLYCRSSGTGGQVICNTLQTNVVAMKWMCMWMYKAPAS
ncbi:MAG: hypothetical protein JNM39_07875 [Bdellovibrionaceae bacterium]|nr:hypothetical protein [Pseudobdellovibrionaceae bacterium]